MGKSRSHKLEKTRPTPFLSQSMKVNAALKQQKNIAVIGAGGHAKVCIDVLRDAGWQVPVCLVNEGGSPPDQCNQVSVREVEDFAGWLQTQGPVAAFVAIGDNRARRRISEELDFAGIARPAAISSKAVLASSVKIGAGVLVMPGAVINADARLDSGAIINTQASVDHDCHIGAYAHVAPASALAGSVRIGAGTLCGIGSRFIPGISVGHNALVAAGAVVVCDVGDDQRVAGIPARILS